MASSVEREWLNWDRPCLPQAARWIVDRFARDERATPTKVRRDRPARAAARTTSQAMLWDVPGGDVARGESPGEKEVAADVCDLREVVCVLPGRRAGRLLLGLLLGECRERGLRLVPPRVLTPGAVVDHVLGIAQPTATALEARLAWLSALRGSADHELRALLPQPPRRDGDPEPWLELAGTIAALHDELAGEGRSFADVADAAERLEMFGEGDRWRALTELHKKQRRALGEAGLVDANDARAEALREASANSAPAGLKTVLIGVADLNAQQRLSLRAAGANVTALIHAPSDLADVFDDMGTPRVDAWTNRHIAVDDDQIILAEKPVDQAQAAMRALAAFASGGACDASQITLGAADSALLGDLDVAAGWAGVSLHHAAGDSLAMTGPARLLLAAAEFIETRRFEHFAALLRHPDLERAVARDSSDDLAREEWLSVLDEYFADHLHGEADGAWLGDAEQQARLKSLWTVVQQILEPLAGRDGAASSLEAPLASWCQGALDVLANVYAIDDAPGDESEADDAPDTGAPRRPRLPQPDARSIDACLALRDALAEIAWSAASLQPSVTAPQAIRIVLDHARAATLSEDLEPGQIETLGWLELHLDPAPRMIIAGVNDGRVPESLTADPFLPDTLRAQMGLMHNGRRYARDAYLLQAIARSRPRDSLRLIVGRRDALNEPLTPSRLLLACDDRTLVSRVKRFARDLSNRPSPPPLGLRRAGDSLAPIVSGFAIPRLQLPLEPPKAMSVTEFSRYLRCQYRWALERVLWLKAFGDDESELSPLSFGSLVHDTLSGLVEDRRVAESDSAERVFAFLSARLHELVRSRHGERPLPAVLIQRARIEQRLRAFSAYQAQAAHDGWRIRHCEIDIDKTVSLDIPGDDAGPMPLRGKIDRIDENVRTGRWRVIDYKTGEAGHGPIRTHHQAKELPVNAAELEWHDLQLPLYWFIAAKADALRLPADAIELGYIVLPRRADGAAWLGAEWTSAHLEHGVNKARDIVREIRAAVLTANFERNRDIDSPFDTFARICQTAAFAPSSGEGESGEGEGDSNFDAGGGDE